MATVDLVVVTQRMGHRMAESKIAIGACVVGVLLGWAAPASALECSTKYFVYASERLSVGDRSTISYGSIGAAIEAQLGVSARVQGSLVADSITLRNNALLNGSAYTNHPVTLQQGARILGQSLPIAPGFACTAPVIPDITPNEDDIYVEGTLSLPPGHYGHLYVTPDSTLFLSGGDYHFEVVVFEPDSSVVGVWQGQPARLLVSGGVMFGDRHQQSISRPGSNANTRAGIVLYSLQSDQLRLGTDSVIYSQIIAPFAEVSVPSRTDVRAPIYGRNVRVEPDSSIGAPVSQPNACQ